MARLDHCRYCSRCRRRNAMLFQAPLILAMVVLAARLSMPAWSPYLSGGTGALPPATILAEPELSSIPAVTTTRPSATTPPAKEPAAKKPAAKKPAPEKPPAKKPAAKKPAAKKPAAKRSVKPVRAKLRSQRG